MLQGEKKIKKVPPQNKIQRNTNTMESPLCGLVGRGGKACKKK